MGLTTGSRVGSRARGPDAAAQEHCHYSRKGALCQECEQITRPIAREGGLFQNMPRESVLYLAVLLEAIEGDKGCKILDVEEEQRNSCEFWPPPCRGAAPTRFFNRRLILLDMETEKAYTIRW
jgi:hypothetical protein